MAAIVAVLVGMVPVIPAVIYFIYTRKRSLTGATRGLILGLNGFNAILLLMAIGLSVVWLLSPSTASAAGILAQTAPAKDPYASLAAGISTGLAAVGAGVAVSGTGAAAVGVIAEKPEFFGRSLIFVGLGEGIAIYGLIIAFLVLNR